MGGNQQDLFPFENEYFNKENSRIFKEFREFL